MRPARIINVEQQTPTAATRSAVVSFCESNRVSEEDIIEALGIIARILEDDERYLQIFLRLEAELDKVRSEREALTRARTYLPKNELKSHPPQLIGLEL